MFLLSGKDLIGVQNLLKKHQALQAEIAGHEPRIKAVTQKGNAMVEEGECSSSGTPIELRLAAGFDPILFVGVLASRKHGDC